MRKWILKNMDTSNLFSKLYDLDNLYSAFLKVRSVSGWKTQTQLYEEDLIFNLMSLQESLINGTYQQDRVTKFILHERGKIRCIESYKINDRIVQSSFCSNVLLPLCMPKLIYDNSASFPGRGTSHFRKRLEKHLNDFGEDDGYILLGDFSKFFDNIIHEVFLKVLKDFGADNETLEFTKMLLKSHRVDISGYTKEEQEKMINGLFNSVDFYHENRPKGKEPVYMEKSLGIGSMIAQVAGVAVPYRIDNLCKIVYGIKGYGRYMDDFYAIHKSKAYLKELLAAIEKECKEYGIILNKKKTQIVKLSHWFTILKTQYKMKGNKVIKKPRPETFKREKKNLKTFKKYKVNKEDAYRNYLSWRGTIVGRFGENSHSLKDIDNYFKYIYGGKVDV